MTAQGGNFDFLKTYDAQLVRLGVLAERYFKEGIQSANEFGRVDELARGQFGLATVYLETKADPKTALALVTESMGGFQRQGMQHEIRLAQELQQRIVKLHPQLAAYL